MYNSVNFCPSWTFYERSLGEKNFIVTFVVLLCLMSMGLIMLVKCGTYTFLVGVECYKQYSTQTLKNPW